MGGLVARWYGEREGGAALTRKLITIGTPHRGAMAAARQLVNGMEVGPVPLRRVLTRFARSLPSAHQLLPQYACLETGNGLEPITAMPLPGVDPELLADGVAFHDALDAAPGVAQGLLEVIQIPALELVLASPTAPIIL
ncbi:MAG: esterase/lipase family protein [Cyanobacteriota bacterium]